MAVTRIKNNQITDSTIVGSSKLVDYSITAAKIANNLTYGSDLTVTGNLTVQGNVTTVDTVNLIVEDPLIVLAANQTSTPTVDIGFIGQRGTSTNIAFVWDESADEFATVFTNDLITNTTITISSYASIHSYDATIGGNLNVTGTSTLTGNASFGNIAVLSSKTIDMGNNLVQNVTDPVGAQDAATKNYVDGIVSAGITIADDSANTTVLPLDGTLTLNGTTNEVTVAITAIDTVTFGLPDNVTITANLTAGNIGVGGQIQSTGNITGGNLISNAAISAATTITATGNITGGNLTTAGTANIGTLAVTGAATVGTTLGVTGNANVGNLGTAGLIVATGNITGGNLITTGVTQTGTLSTTGNALVGGNLIVMGNITYQNVDDLRIEDPVIIMGTGPNGAPLTTPDSMDRGIFMEYYTSARGNSFVGWQNSSGNMIAASDVSFASNNVVNVNSWGTFQAGNVYSQTVTATGNITGGNVSTAGALTVTGNITGGNLNTAGKVVATGNLETGANLVVAGYATVTGNITGGNLITSGEANVGSIYSLNGGQFVGNVGFGNISGTGTSSFTGNIDGGNISTTGQLSATGNVNGGNLITNGLVYAGTTITAGGNITGGNIGTAGQVTATGNITGGNLITTGQANLGNIRISGDTITGTNGQVLVNSALADVNFVVSGDTQANLLFVDAGTDTVLINTGTTTTGATLKIGGTNSLMLPVGTTGERPTGTTGMVRFNSSLNNLEFYDANSWQTAGSQFTVITANTQTGDGSTVAFTLPADSTTAGTIVSINGVVQIPITAYSISGNVCTFTEAPLSTDVIDFRELATTSEVTSLAGTPGSLFEANATKIEFDVTGNIIPSANVLYSLGNATNRFSDLYLSGSSIYLGNVIMKTATGNTIAFYQPDGTTPATIAASSVDTTQIASGTSSMAVIASGGNIRANIAGSTVQTLSTGGANITGYVNATGNITGNYILGNGSQLTGIDATSIQNGTANVRTFLNGNVTISAAGTSNVAVVSSSGMDLTGNLTVSGNITATGNLNYDNVTNLVVGDPLIYIGANNSGNVYDLGYVVSWTDSKYQHGGLVRDASDGVFKLFGNVVAEPTTTVDFTNAIYQPLWTGAITASGNITAGNLSVSTGTVSLGNIVNTNANGVGNIGSATTYFNTVFAKATSAQYADLAEKYTADAEYTPGTVLEFGGENEVTVCTHDMCTRVAGVVSTNPSYIMNAGLEGANVVTLALTGRVPTKVTGTVRKGDMMVSNGDGTARAEENPRVGTVIGKALENFDGTTGVIEVVVGRL